MGSDLVWLTNRPSQTAIKFWQKEYPDIQTVSTREYQMRQAGYRIIDHFPLSQQSWKNYYEPINTRLNGLEHEMAESIALQDLTREIDIYEKYLGEFGYEMFILQAV